MIQQQIVKVRRLNLDREQANYQQLVICARLMDLFEGEAEVGRSRLRILFGNSRKIVAIRDAEGASPGIIRRSKGQMQMPIYRRPQSSDAQGKFTDAGVGILTSGAREPRDANRRKIWLSHMEMLDSPTQKLQIPQPERNCGKSPTKTPIKKGGNQMRGRKPKPPNVSR